ncbi:MAG: glycosyltransferase [Actinobacteria bacterium]|nr:MAG: glycosyltransferase [Actinomycetota bacterium]
MFASIQYLLTGLPVVTTRHIGGRDEFFDSAYVRWVEDDPDAVASAVDELVTLSLDPQMIREATLARMRQHRTRFQTWIQQAILAEGGELGRWSGAWPEGLPNKLHEPPARPADVIADISREPLLAPASLDSSRPLHRFPRHESSRSITGSALERSESGPFSLLHADPVVLFAPDWQIFDPGAALWSVLEALPNRSSYLALEPTWTLRGHHAKQVADRVRQIAQRFGDLSVVTCCPTAGEIAAAEQEGLAALHCSAGALVREDLFAPSPGRQPKFDAIYDAKWFDYKRHDLAGSVRSLALIAAAGQSPEERTIDSLQRAHAAVKRATWMLQPWGSISNKRWLSCEEINAGYNRARVGLCLSGKEGVMAASVQYLMAGLPVVTTRNLGGRDEFFDPLYVRWVDAKPEAVANAVHELVGLDLDPQMIRDATLAKVEQHRDRLQAWIRQVILAEGGELGRWAGDWPTGLPNKLREPNVRAADAIAEIEQG